MTTRYTAGDEKGIDSGYSENVPEEITIPSCTIEDVDRSVFNLFDKQLNLTVHNSKSGEVKNVPVIFASGERWALFQKDVILRDNSQTIILPILMIKRTEIIQDQRLDIAGRGINQQVGELVIKKKLSSTDRSYQNLISKLSFENQTNVSNIQHTNALDTVRGNLGSASGNRDGNYLEENFDDNVWEFITIPTPQFYTATYEITIWTQYITHMNQVLQQMLAGYLMQGHATYKVETSQGYWFLASVVDGMFQADDNLNDYGEEERLVKYSFKLKVQAYMIAGTTADGLRSAVKKYISSTKISFELATGSDVDEIVTSYTPSMDDPTDPEYGMKSADIFPKVVYDPIAGKNKVAYAKVISKNAITGETVYKKMDDLSVIISNKISNQ